ncbi:hypothetical protein [Prevotella sp. S7-1-8]|uniref:hypothetical protein n=1 Tax=Prevotella sp. S7-1-8 TaxID=1284775 RepID=UPI000AAF2645|nr:hypothetical protein [Prevotella sp. S7-1-8]
MTEIIDTQETTREKKQYVRPQITMIPMQAEHALLAGSPGAQVLPPEHAGDDDEDPNP